MDVLQLSGIASATLSLLCIVPYIRDIFLRKTKPERASWFIWTVLGAIAFFSQMAKGATDSLWLAGGQTVEVLIVFLLAIPYGVGGFTKRDIAALMFSCIGLLLWSITREAAVALYLVIAIDLAGSILTIIKSYEDPGSETLITWILSGTSGIFGAVAVGKWDVILLSYPVYIILINYVIAAFILFGKKNIN